MEVVGVVRGVTFVDDSKATNVASTIACIQAFKNEQIILLVGGVFKEREMDSIFQATQFKAVVCFGQSGKLFFDATTKNQQRGFVFEKFVDAVNFCKKIAIAGDYVLLSPACASFDEFSSYAERGDCFKNLILEDLND